VGHEVASIRNIAGGGRRRAVAALVMMITALGGCSLFNPHVHEPSLMAPLDVSSTEQERERERETGQFAGDLPAAIDAANRQRERYLDAADLQSYLRNASPLIIAGLSAAALYLAIVDAGSTNTFAALGIGGATVFGLSSFYDNRPRQRLYYGGAQAIGCVVLSYRPLLMTTEDYGRLQKAVQDLGAAMGTARGTLAELEALRAGLRSGPGLPAELDPEIARARDVLARAQTNYDEGLTLRDEIDVAGFTLRQRVLAIVHAVDQEILKTEPEPAAALSLASSLGPTTTALVGGLPSGDLPRGIRAFVGAEAAAPDPNRQRATTLIARLQSELQIVNQHAATVGNFSSRAAALQRQVGEADACQPPELTGGLEVVPEDTQLQVSAPATLRFTVFGGDGIPRAILVRDGTGGKVVIEQPRIEGGFVQVPVTVQEGATGTAELMFADQSGRGRKRTVLIVTAGTRAREGPAAPSPSERSEPQTPFEGQEHLVRMAQRVLGFTGDDIDGDVGLNTRARLREFQQGNGLTVNGTLDEPTLLAINDVGRAEARGLSDQLTPFEQGLSLEERKRVENELVGVDPNLVADGLFDAATREALWNYQSAKEIPMTGTVDEATAAAMGLQ
jgi:Putative peptidoglycan binding domain